MESDGKKQESSSNVARQLRFSDNIAETISKMDHFSQAIVPKPRVYYTGVAEETHHIGRLADLIEVSVTGFYYVIKMSLPKCNSEDLCFNVDIEGRVIVQGVIPPGELFPNGTNAPGGSRRIRLCPQGAWGFYFALPGPVSTRGISYRFRSDTILEVLVRKRKEVDAATGAPILPWVSAVAAGSTSRAATFAYRRVA